MPDHPPGAAMIDLVRPLFAAQQPQERGFTRTVAAPDDGVLPLAQCEGKIIENRPFRARIGDKNVLDFNQRTMRRFHHDAILPPKKQKRLSAAFPNPPCVARYFRQAMRSTTRASPSPRYKSGEDTFCESVPRSEKARAARPKNPFPAACGSRTPRWNGSRKNGRRLRADRSRRRACWRSGRPTRS